MAAGRSPAVDSRRGLWLMLGAAISFAAMDAGVKALRGAGFSTAEVIVYRTGLSLPVLWLALRARRVSLRPSRWDLIALRSLFGISAMAATFFAVRALTLVQHTVLHLLQPIFVAALAPLLLRERLHWVTAAALGVAAVGALVVALPGPELAGPPLVPALMAVAAALSSALAHLTVRTTSATEPAERVVFHFHLHGAIVGLAWALGTDGLTPITSVGVAGLILGMGAAGTLGQVLMTSAYHHDHAARIAMVGYAGIPASVALDAIFWDAPAGLHALVGAALMVGAGVLLHRRR